MTRIDRLLPLFLAAALLLAGNGLQGTLVALRASQEGFPALIIGFMGTAYYAGFMGACRYAPSLIREVGHIRVFAALAAIAAASALLHVLLINFFMWILLRLLTGFCFAGLFMVMESWLNDSSENSDRARVLSIYATVDLVAVTAAQFLLPAIGPESFEIFAVLSILFTISLVPVALSNRSKPTPPAAFKLNLRMIWNVSPLACMGCFAIGLTNSAFRLVGPVYATNIGLDVSGVAFFMSAGILGGAVLLYPLGMLSDRLDRRWIVIAASLGACLAGILLTLLSGQDRWLVFMGAFLFGAFALPLYSLSVAHGNDQAKPGQYVMFSAGLLFFFALGATAGPSIASGVMQQFGPASFFMFTSTAHGLLVVAALLRMVQRPHIPLPSRARFVALLRTSPSFFKLASKARKSHGSGQQKPRSWTGRHAN